MIPKRLTDEIIRWMDEKRYGSLQINFQEGKIVNVNRVESIKVEMLITNNPDTKVSMFAGSDILKLTDP